MANKGLLGDRLSDEQYTYLQTNVADWYDTVTVLFCNNSFSGVFIDAYDASTGYWEMDQVSRDGTVTHSRSNDPDNYRATVWNGEPGNYLYLYGDNGHVGVSSYTTLGLGLIPAVRNVLDTEDLVAVKDTNWLWVNLNNVLGYLKGLGVKAINALTFNDIMELSVEWDSNMSWRIFSPYMVGWVKGQINELNIANYLFKQYGSKWDRLYDALTEEYDVLNNVSIHEVEHTDDVRDENNSSSTTTTSSGNSSNTSTGNGNSSSDVYAYNDDYATHDSASSNSNSSTDSGSSSSSGSSTSSGEFDANNDKDRDLVRTGFNGIPQDAIEKELELRKHLVLDTIRDDITYVMTIPYYGGKY